MTLNGSSKVTTDQVTKAKDTIHNPNDARHFMRIKPIPGMVRVKFGDEVLAESKEALRLQEVGRDFYDPIIYFPREDVTAHFMIRDKDSHCPLKGDAIYFDLLDEDRQLIAEEVAWCYPTPFNFAKQIKDRIAFYGNKVTIEEHPTLKK